MTTTAASLERMNYNPATAEFIGFTSNKVIRVKRAAYLQAKAAGVAYAQVSSPSYWLNLTHKPATPLQTPAQKLAQIEAMMHRPA